MALKSKTGDAVCGRGEADEQSVVGEVGMEGDRLSGAARGLGGASTRLGLAFLFSLPNLVKE